MAAAFDDMVDALDAAVASAENTEAAMRRFLADASHELRTPLAALQASAETLLRDQPGRPHRDELEAAVARDASRMGRLIDDLLSLARLEGAQPVPAEPIDLADLAHAQVDEARRRPSIARIAIDTHPAPVRGDQNGLERVVRNLLDNALAATPKNGEVRITVSTVGDTARLRVSDTGPGIAQQDRERVFERFVRINQANTSGTGLGLAIARRIARQHGGDLTCDGTADGASFTLRLPVDTHPQ
jgi:signal transduction histidine kinase